MQKQKPIPIEAKLVFKKMLTVDVVELHLETHPHFHFEAGQFISIIVPGAGPGGRDLRRAYSIASQPEKDRLELCVKIVEGGPGTEYLNRLKVGETMKAIAPYGDFIFKTPPDRHAVFISTGTGVAPFRSMLFSSRFLGAKPRSTTLLYGARDVSDLLYGDELSACLKPGHFIEALSRVEGNWTGFKGRVTDWILQNEARFDWQHTEFYLCGSGAMIDEVKKILVEKKVEKKAIHQEAYYRAK